MALLPEPPFAFLEQNVFYDVVYRSRPMRVTTLLNVPDPFRVAIRTDPWRYAPLTTATQTPAPDEALELKLAPVLNGQRGQSFKLVLGPSVGLAVYRKEACPQLPGAFNVGDRGVFIDPPLKEAFDWVPASSVSPGQRLLGTGGLFDVLAVNVLSPPPEGPWLVLDTLRGLFSVSGVLLTCRPL